MGLLSNFRHKFHNAFFTQVLYGTVASLAIFLSGWDNLDRMRDRLGDKLQNDTDTFDFIVVGGGTAGSVVANRLSQYYSVLLLEMGGEPNPFQAVPGLALFMPNHPETDWMHRSIPQKKAFGNSIKREASLSQGKSLGGSSNLNFLNYLRGSPKDYEHWVNVTGDESWSYDKMKKYFLAVEDYTKESNGNTQGAMKIDIPDYVGLSAEFITAGHQLGFKHVDLNEPFVEGFDVNYLPIYKGVRQGPYQSYLKPARSRKSLTIRKFSQVSRILFKENSTTAYGVEYERHGEVKIAKATKEVIVSAGALSTPKLLMISGIGPSKHLKEVGIPVRLNLPVGRNLQDHISTLVGPFFIKEHRSLLIGKDIDSSSFVNWGTDGKGPLTSTFYQASGLVLSSFAKSREEDKYWPDIHLQLSSVGIHKTYAADLAHAYNLQEPLLNQFYSHAVGKQSFSISVTNSRPVARGEILLTGSNANDKILINPKYLEDPHGVDVSILQDGVKLAVRMAENTMAFQKLSARLTETKLPGCEEHEVRSDQYWECYIRQFSLSMHAYCGTASMGKSNSKYSVVDPELKVIGAKGLRVVDASVLPSVPVASPQGAVLAMAEKGVDNILRYWRQIDGPSKKPQESESNTGGDSFDSFSGFSFSGKDIGKSRSPAGTRKSKQKSNSKAPRPQTNKVVVSTSARVSTTTSVAPGRTTPKPEGDFVPAETRFSHNLTQIMEFLRNSRAINEAIDDDTYNNLVQNFGARIVDLMTEEKKKNKTEIFFLPVTTTTVSPPTTTYPHKSNQGSNKPSYSAKFSSQKNPTSKTNGLSTTTKPAKITTSVSKKAQQPSNSSTVPSSSVSFSSGGKNLIDGVPAKFSPLLSSQNASKSSNISKKAAIPSKPYFTPVTTTTLRPNVTSIDDMFSTNPTTESSDEFEEDDTTGSFEDDEETTTSKPFEETSPKPNKKIVELILNPDLTINKTKEIDSDTYTSLTSSASVVSSPSVSPEKKPELIEYRTEEVRPFPVYPPYKIFSVPGQEFSPSGRLIAPHSPHLHYHSHPHSSGLSVIPSPSLSIASLTPPPPQSVLTQSLPRLAQYQQPQLLPPPKLPSVIDENLPIQTAKTVLYYTQVFPRDPNEILTAGNVVGHLDSRNIGRIVSSSSSNSLLPPNLRQEDQSQNLVQFFSSK